MQRFLVSCVLAEGLVILTLAWLLIGRTEEPRALERGTVAREQQQDAVPVEAAAGPRADHANDAREEPTRQEIAAGVTEGMSGTLLFGCATGKRGEVVEQGSVYAVREGEPRGISCNIEGERGYAMPGLAAGKWVLTVRAEGFKTEQVDVEVTGGLQRRDLLLDATHALKVIVVTPDGEPLAQALRKLPRSRIAMSLLGVATREEPPAAFPMTVNRTVMGLGVGKWRDNLGFSQGPRLPDQYGGVLELDAPPPVWVSLVYRHLVVGKALAQPGQEEVRIEIAVDALKALLARARLQVADSMTRRPLVGARVGFSDRQTGGPGQSVGEDGVVVCEDLPPGILELTISEAEHEHYHKFIRFEPGSDLDLGVIAVDPKTKLAGLVVDAAGKPATGVGLSYFRLERYPPDMPLRNGISAQTDAQGRFELWGVGRGRYLVSASNEGRAAAATRIVDTSAGPVEDVLLQLEPTIGIQLENSVPRSKSFLVTFRARSGEALWNWSIRPGPSFPLPVPPGSYTVEIRDEQTGAVRSFPFEVAPGARLRVP